MRPFPGEDFSKIKPSFWFTWRVALRVTCFIAPPPPRRFFFGSPLGSLALGDQSHRGIDGRASRQFRAAPQRRIP